MKLLLTSSGLTNGAIAEELSRLAGKSLTELDVLFVPTAANTEGGDKGWLINNLVHFQKANVRSIDILDIAAVDKEVWQKRFEEKDVICFGGGNEKYLAEVFSSIGMKEFLTSLSNDKVYMGISAGSMVAGKFMPHALYPLIFPEEDFGEITKEAMGLYGFCFIPHLNSSFFSQIRKEILENLKGTFNGTVYATDDETAISIVDGDVRLVGSGDRWVFEK